MVARHRWAVLLTTCLVFGSAFAQQDPAAKQVARERELLRRAQTAQKQAEDARAVLEAEKGKLAEQLKDVESRASKVAGSAARERQRAEDLQRALSEVSRARDLLQKDKEGLTARVADLERQLREAQGELVRVRQSLAERDAALKEAQALGAAQGAARNDAEQKNAQLYALSRELIERYRTQGFWDAVKRKEPFTGLEQIKVENLLEGYRDRADEARVIPTPQR
jgi:chromosome segregation ATPase